MNDALVQDQAARQAAEALLKAMFLSEVRGQVDLLTDEAARASAVRLEMNPDQTLLLARRLRELGPPRRLLLRGLAQLREIVTRGR